MHLEWRLGAFGRHTQQNQDSAPKKLPRSRAAKRGNSMAWRAQGDRFWTCVGVIFSVKCCVQNLYKKRGFCSLGLQFAPRIGFNLHLALASRCTLSGVWARLGVTPSKTRTQHRKSFPEAGPRNGETAWPGEPKETVFGPALGWSSVSNVASRTYKKRGFCRLGLQFANRIGFEMHLEWRLGAFGRHTRQNQDSAPKKLPRSRAAKRGNSMAWGAQGDRFWTCVGVIFSVKRCVQNL